MSNDTAIAYAYHLHKAGMHQESYTLNKKLADGASIIGDLDIAERCYNIAIEDAEQLQNIYNLLYCYVDLSHNVYIVWGRYEEAIKSLPRRA